MPANVVATEMRKTFGDYKQINKMVGGIEGVRIVITKDTFKE